MIYLKHNLKNDMLFYRCCHCDNLVLMSKNPKTYCSWCSKYIPNTPRLQTSMYLRREYHYKMEIYGAKVKS